MKKLFLLCICLGIVLCGESKKLDISNVNKFVDAILEKARQELPDPMRLPPRSTFVELSDGVLWGMSNITRLGDSEVSVDGDLITIKSKITTDEMKGRYTWTKQKMRMTWQGFVLFISDDFEADVELSIRQHDEGVVHPKLEKFDIQKFKSTRFEITGVSYFTWVLSQMTTMLSGIFQQAIGNSIEGPLQEAIEREMKEIAIDYSNFEMYS